MINAQQLLPVLRHTMPKASDQQILEALGKLSAAHPNLNNAQAAAAIQKYMQQKAPPTSMGGLARKGAI